MIPLPAVVLLLTFTLLIGFIWGHSTRDDTPPKPELAMCCGKPLSEWFVDPAAGMICIVCKRTHPFITHEDFRSTRFGTPGRDKP